MSQSEGTIAGRDGITYVDTQGLFANRISLPTHSYFMDGVIDEASASHAARAIHALAQGGPFTIYLNTPGGDRQQTFGLYDLIRGCGVDVRIIGWGDVFSAGTVLLQAATFRWLLPSTRLMIHPGYSSIGLDLDENTMRSATAVRRERDRSYEILGAAMGKTRDELLSQHIFDKYYSAKAAVRLGLADRVVERI